MDTEENTVPHTSLSPPSHTKKKESSNEKTRTTKENILSREKMERSMGANSYVSYELQWKGKYYVFSPLISSQNSTNSDDNAPLKKDSESSEEFKYHEILGFSTPQLEKKTIIELLTDKTTPSDLLKILKTNLIEENQLNPAHIFEVEKRLFVDQKAFANDMLKDKLEELDPKKNKKTVNSPGIVFTAIKYKKYYYIFSEPAKNQNGRTQRKVLNLVNEDGKYLEEFSNTGNRTKTLEGIEKNLTQIQQIDPKYITIRNPDIFVDEEGFKTCGLQPDFLEPRNLEKFIKPEYSIEEIFTGDFYLLRFKPNPLEDYLKSCSHANKNSTPNKRRKSTSKNKKKLRGSKHGAITSTLITLKSQSNKTYFLIFSNTNITSLEPNKNTAEELKYRKLSQLIFKPQKDKLKIINLNQLIETNNNYRTDEKENPQDEIKKIQNIINEDEAIKERCVFKEIKGNLGFFIKEEDLKNLHADKQKNLKSKSPTLEEDLINHGRLIQIFKKRNRRKKNTLFNPPQKTYIIILVPLKKHEKEYYWPIRGLFHENTKEITIANNTTDNLDKGNLLNFIKNTLPKDQYKEMNGLIYINPDIINEEEYQTISNFLETQSSQDEESCEGENTQGPSYPAAK